ncbi:unnamed protein product [Pylaiella littoralis]
MVTLCVLMGVLVWVGRGGLDIQPSPSSHPPALSQRQAATPRVAPLGPSNLAGTGNRTEEFEGKLSASSKKAARDMGLTSADIEEARAAATNTVREALRNPGGLPPPNPENMYSSSCGVRVEGLPLYNSKGQRCCKSKEKPAAEEKTRADGVPRGRRVLPGEGGGGGEDALGGVLGTEGTGAVEEQVSCFPSFVIAGTQKSGTTALTGILEQHPQVMMSARKELHFFDRKPPNRFSVENYAGNFASFDASQAVENGAPFIVGEATPFYLASRDACKHIRRVLPDVRLVVLVRDPVKRSYSEHQMKVRRVEEQADMLRLLAEQAEQIYACAAKLLPSPDVNNLSEEEVNMLTDAQTLAKAIGECAGDAGQHGKWLDAMIPFIRRIRAKIKGSKRALGVPATRNTAGALEGFREDLSRCFPLQTVVDYMEILHPRGTWKMNWDKSGKTPAKGGGGLLLPPGAKKTPRGKGGLGADGFPGAPRKASRGKLGGPQNRKLREEGGWTADEFLLDGGDRVGYEYYWNSTVTTGAGEGVGAGAGFASGSVADNEFSGLYGAAGGGWDHGWDDDEEYAAGWGGLGDRLEEQIPYAGDGSFSGGSGMRGLQEFEGSVSPNESWTAVWGAWGTGGKRTYDKTCYQRYEKVIPAGHVMKAEMGRLKKCFDGSLHSLGGLGALEEAASVAAAEAIDDGLSKCFKPTPGIADQYIYRSLYGVQAYHCLKSMPRDQVMFIESDELRDKPEETMSKIHEHIGVPDYQYPSLDQNDIMAELEKKYPDFEKRTGWRFESAYTEEIPEALAKEIREFVAPDMRMFARLTGQNYSDWGVDDRHKEEEMAGGLDQAIQLFETEFDKGTARIAEAKRPGQGGSP